MLIDRLLRRNLHDFATLVTKLLRMPPEEGENRILVQWAIQEVRYIHHAYLFFYRILLIAYQSSQCK